MDEQQIRDLFDSLKTELLATVDQKNSGLAANLTREIKGLQEALKTTAPPADDSAPTQGKPDDAGKLSLKALQQQLTEVQKALETERQQTQAEREAAIRSDKRSLISQAIAAKGLQNPGVLQDVLSTRFGDKLKKEGSDWFVQEGDSVKPFDAVFTEFVSSPEGKFFVPPTSTQGSGAQESSASPPPTQGNKATAANALNDAFKNI